MDAWGAGIVLLDLLTHGVAWEETKHGFDAASLFEEEAIQSESWYRWLAEPEPIDLVYLVGGAGLAGGGPQNARECLDNVVGLHSLLASLLEKNPSHRATAAELCQHPLLATLSSSALPTPPAFAASGPVEVQYGSTRR